MSTPFEHVFVLNTGRCGSLTFSAACQAGIDNYTCSHESRLAVPGEARLAYPAGHIEVDNRLIWFAGRLHERYGDAPFYVHLHRDAEAVARSYARRRALGFLLHAWTRGVYVGLEDMPDFLVLARDLVATVNANIRHFMASRPHRMEVRLAHAREDFLYLRERIGATGDAAAGAAVWARRLNASLSSDAAAGVEAPADRPAPPSAFALDAPLPDAVRADMERRLPARDGAGDGVPEASVTGRAPDLAAQLQAIRADFAGAPVLCLTVAEHIVRIRRGVDLDHERARFFALTRHAESGAFLARQLSLRWLVSCLDTWADHAPLAEAAGALALATLVNTVKLAETERLVMRDPVHDPARVAALARDFPVPLFGGLNAFRLESGDMVRNLFRRLEIVLVDEPFLCAALERIAQALRDAPNLFQRLARHHPALF